MYPVYRYMEPHHQPCSLSHQMDHNSHPYHHSMPMHYNAMNMNNPPDYNPYGFHAFRPPYSHYQPPPQFYHAGPYPPYPDHPYYYPYFIPPPPNSHCCGCPNHACNQRENNGVKIVEQSPEPEQKESRDLSNYPYPVVWFPSGYLNDKNMDNLKNLAHGGEEKKKAQLPWPLVWMPGNEKPEETVKELKESNATPKSVEEPPKFKIIPLKFLENGNEKENKENNKVRSIPVKQAEGMPEMQSQLDDDKKCSVVEKPMEEKEVKKSSSSKQTSPPKSSKLPPVCLRVDPLPRKKGSNVSSRSPSPPGINETKKHNEKKDIKVVEIKDEIPSNIVVQMPEKVVSADKKVETKSFEDENVKNITEEASDCKKIEERKITKSLSESDAAVLIQSAYRGYEVRRTQLLDKLRKIACVRWQVADVRSQIHQFEASDEIDSKQRAVVSETLMNLLLQLDTIQGLHPDVREIRKSLARELICLQEKLDALGSCITKSNGLDEVEKQSKDEALEVRTQSVPVLDGEKLEKKAEDDEQNTSAEMTESFVHEEHSSDSKMVEESELISVEKEAESLDDNIDEPFDPLVSSLHGEENEVGTIMQSEPNESATDSTQVLDMQPENEEDKPKLEEERMACVVDEVKKIADEALTRTPEIVPAGPVQNESAEVSEKLKLNQDSNEDKSAVMPCFDDVIAVTAASADEDKIEQIAEEISEGMLKLKEENDEVSCVSAQGNEIVRIAEESATITPDIVPAQSGHAEISEEKTDSNAESSSVMLSIPAEEANKIGEIAEESAAMTPDIVPTQSEHVGISEEKPYGNAEISSSMASVASKRDRPMTPDIVPAQNESANDQIAHVQDSVSEEKRLLEENQKLREMLEKLLEAGKEQLGVISSLSGRVKNLEKKITSSQKKKPRVKRNKISKSSSNFTANNNNIISSAA